MKLNTLKTLIIAISLLISPFCASAAQEQTDNNSATALGSQLKINRWTLLNSTDEQIRIETAVELLKDHSPEARGVLLEALSSTSNTLAQNSVCKAISQFRSWSKLIPNYTDFIEPLINILTTSKKSQADLAAQASLIFSYRQIDKHLKEIINSTSLGKDAKLNAIYALQIRPDKEAISELIDLLDSDNAVIASAAGDALQEWLPLGNDKQDWLKVLKDLEKKSRSDILRERLLAQQDKVRQLSEEVSKWQSIYIDALDNIYLQTTDDTAKAKLITENLASDNASIRLWAVEKIDMWRKSGKQLPFDTLTEPLLALVSDDTGPIRQAAAQLLGLLTNVNSAEKLLAQLKVESTQTIKKEQLIALGQVCNYALSPGAEIAIDSNLRKETLAAASDFLTNSDPVIGAEVIRNLLLQNGMDANSVKPYFQLIATAYSKPQATIEVKSAMINEMARLCSSDSFYNTIAADIFSNIFETEIQNPDIRISEPAIVGFTRIDQAKAFAKLKEIDFSKHPSQKVRYLLIDTAGAIGTADDLEWLGAILVSTVTDEEKHLATSAMMNIFQHCQSDILFNWAKIISETTTAGKETLISTKVQTLLELAETKAEAEKNTALLKPIRQSLAQRYTQSASYGLAAKYYGILIQDSTDTNERSILTNNMLEVHLLAGQVESAKQLVANILLTGDISGDSLTAQALNKHFTQNKNSQISEQILTAIGTIEITAANPRPQWQQLLANFKTLLTKPAETADQPNAPIPQ